MSKTGIIESEFDQYLNISISDSSVKVFKNFEYNIVYYDLEARSEVKVKGLVVGFGGSSSNPSIILKYRKEDISIKYQSKNEPVCNSNCRYYKYCYRMLNGKNTMTVTKCPITTDHANTEKYETIGELTIPVSNIYSISLVVDNTSTHINSINKKDEVKIVLLGISATQVRFMIINMKFIDDQLDNAFKEINLRIGNRYKVVYAKKETNSTNGCNCGNIYELEGTLTNIEEVYNCDRDPDTSFSIVRSVNCGHPEEIVGIHNSIYAACDISTDKDKFLDGEPVKTDIKLTFDTTDVAFHGTHDIILLSQIRDVDKLPGGIEDNSCNCNNCTKDHPITSEESFIIGNTSYWYSKGLIYKKDNTNCCVDAFKLEDILKYYFGE